MITSAAKPDNSIVQVAAPILESAGYSRKGATWTQTVGNVVRKIRIRRMLKYDRVWTIELHLGVIVPESGACEEILFNHLQNLDAFTGETWQELRAALTLDEPILFADRERIVTNALRCHALPLLERLGTLEGLIACYLGDALRRERSPLGRMDWRQAKFVGLPWRNVSVDVVNVPVLGAPDRHLRNRDLRGKKGAVLHLWNAESEDSQKQFPLLMQLKEATPVYGIHTDDDPDRAAAFLADTGDPFEICGYDDKRIWRGQAVPQTFVLDGKGRVVAYFGALSVAQLEEKLIPVIERAKQGVFDTLRRHELGEQGLAEN